MGACNTKQCLKLLGGNYATAERRVHGYVSKPNEDLNFNVGEDVEKKWKQIQKWEKVSHPVYQDNRCIKINRALFAFISSPLVFIILNGFIIWGIYTSDIPKQTISDGYKDAMKGVAGLYNMVLALMFTSAIQRYKESKKLYSALCGDVKAFAIWLTTLSQDHVKYNLIISKDTKKFQGNVRSNVVIDDTFEKVRMLLAVLAPVVKRVIRRANNDLSVITDRERLDYNKLDDKYHVQQITYCCCIKKWVETSGLKTITEDEKVEFKEAMGNLSSNSDKKLIDNIYSKYSRYNMDAWGSLLQTDKNKKVIFEKVKMVSDKTDMNLFEVLMYCLLDEVNDLNERDMGIDNGNERDLISKWNNIYQAYGSLMSYNKYVEPLAIRIILVSSLIVYSVAATFMIRDDGNLSIWIALANIAPYLMVWMLTNLLVSPFSRRTFFVVENVTSEGRETQRHVNKLLECRSNFDNVDFYRKKQSNAKRQGGNITIKNKRQKNFTSLQKGGYERVGNIDF
jgi:hypothetical protein